MSGLQTIMQCPTRLVSVFACVWLAVAMPAWAEENEVVEEIIVVGTQIRGASISDALPVSVMSADSIEALGIDSGEDLLEFMAENGTNFFNEAESISGGVNSVRGDIGAFNLRDLGTGNTLVLLNGRRVINSPGFQTERVGGSFVPATTGNSNTLPINGIERVEVLRDGASAIYGADAVAGVVNTVLQDDFEGFSIRAKFRDYQHFDRGGNTLTAKFGKDFNEGRTNVGVFFNYFERDRVRADEDSRMGTGDLRDLVVGTPWEGSTSFRNTSANSLFGQFDAIPSVSSFGIRNTITDSAGEFEIFPSGDGRCAVELPGYGTCLAPDGQGVIRRNLNDNRDVSGELERASLFVYINHQLDNDMESFTELSWYEYDTNTRRHASASFSSSRLEVGRNNYYNPLGPCGSPNRLPDSVIGTDVPCEGVALLIDNYRYADAGPRVVDNDGTTWRFLQGLRGTLGDWDWETAISYSAAERDDVTHNRVSNTLMQEALNDPTPAAYNPFSAGVDSNIERALIDVYRRSETELMTFDVKFSNPSLFDLPAGPVGLVTGFEYRKESFEDDRDPRLDGRIRFTDRDGDAFPRVSDVVNSSPTPSNDGDRNVTSLFAELQVPVLETLDLQLALRYEDFSDINESTTVGKVAFGWRPINQVLVRGSWSEAFRAPNLITVNEKIVARSNSNQTDYTCLYAAENGGDPGQDTLDCVNTTQRTAQGSDGLKPEESENYSFGLVVEPIDNLTLTLDYWSIEKEDSIGLFGTENHLLLDLMMRLQAGNGNCAAATVNPAVERGTPGADESAIYIAAGMCPAGDVNFVADEYANLDKRTVEGHDVGVYYTLDTGIGNFDFRYVATFLDEYEQEGGAQAGEIQAAQASGLVPANYPIVGLGDLLGRDGNIEDKQTFGVIWRKDAYRASVSGLRKGEFYQSSLTLSDGTRWAIDSMTTYNASFDYRTDIGEVDTRFRLGVNNLTDERAPLADRYFGYFADVHSNYGRSYYLDIKLQF